MYSLEISQFAPEKSENVPGPKKKGSSSNYHFAGAMLNFGGDIYIYIYTWNSKQPVFYGCFNWMIPNHYIKNGCFTKHPLKNGGLGYQV